MERAALTRHPRLHSLLHGCWQTSHTVRVTRRCGAASPPVRRASRTASRWGEQRMFQDGDQELRAGVGVGVRVFLERGPRSRSRPSSLRRMLLGLCGVAAQGNREALPSHRLRIAPALRRVTRGRRVTDRRRLSQHDVRDRGLDRGCASRPAPSCGQREPRTRVARTARGATKDAGPAAAG